ncbi:MAG: HlyD family efflux transporter periplasmic adaptor subunit [Ruminococcus sp.]|nr:HlyD family efflux transporter periplasmic adaptor subunit [Ruminococcus sp.]
MTSSRAVPLLLRCYDAAYQDTASRKTPPAESFMTLFSCQLLQLRKEKLNADDTFCDVPPPKISGQYQFLADSIDKLDEEHRILYLVSTFGEMGVNTIADALGKPADQIKEQVHEASSLHLAEAKKRKKMDGTQLIRVSTAFQNADGTGLSGIRIPPILLKSLEHQYGKSNSVEIKPRKELPKMNEDRVRKKQAKIRKWIITVCILAAIIIVAIIFLPRLARMIQDNEEETVITTYTAEAITYGDVDTTISGSGTLSAIDSETLIAPYTETEDEEDEVDTETTDMLEGISSTAQNGGVSSSMQSETYEVTELNIIAGDSFEEGDVLAVLTDESDETTEITAEYDGIALEVSVRESDEITSGDSVAVIMSTEGFELSLSVDEQEIATVEEGQEVTITVDALSESYTGEVFAVSYNGSSDGSSTSYQITVQMDYEEGIYPAMSASTEIVTESSDEGLLVPAEAVNTSGDNSYVYLAPSDAEEGAEYDEDELTLSDLTKVTVETGMSDGTYILIKSDELSEGDLILITNVTSTLTGSDIGDDGGMMGGFSGDMRGDMDFGDMDFGDMPQGGGGFRGQ